MWHPPERIRHPLPATEWPTREQAAASRLFSPIPIGPLTAQQRTWVPAMVPWRATEDGFVTPDVIDWYARFAGGRPGVLVVEATGIRDIPSGPLLRIGHERFIPGLRALVDAVREASNGETLVFIQLIDFLRIFRRPTREAYFGRYLELGDHHRERLAHLVDDKRMLEAPEEEVRAALLALDEELVVHILSHREMEDYLHGYRERVWDMHLPHIRELPSVLPGLFAQAADNAFAAGFHGVELHYAHAYTMASFLSALNTRDDGYGGPPEHRARLPLEVLAAVRQRVGADHVVGVRFLGDDVVEGGNRIDDAQYFAVELARGGSDYLSVSKGGKFEDAQQPKVGRAAYPYTGPSGYECMPTVFSDERGPFGRNINLSTEVRRAVREAGLTTPVVASGGICSFELAEGVLELGGADIVAAARQTLADPDWFLKMKIGRGAEVRQCQYTNYCEGLDQQHKQVTCKLWDRVELDEPDVKLDESGKRRLLPPRWRPGGVEE
jgi:2,4-dienoyl-CoA reductase-like NADH-dependent reductase (Old Yellow Enzyme family)